MAQKQQQTTPQGEQVANTVSSLETFFKGHAKLIEWIIVAILAVVCIFLAVNKWYINPLKAEAKDQMFSAEQLFREGNFETALNGDGNILGFSQIVDQYGSKAGKSVYFYAAICELQLGNNEEALSYLGKYSTSDKIMKARALCCTGDAYSNLNQLEKALDCYKSAANVEDNVLAAGYLLKAGIVAEKLGKKQEALDFYQTIKDNYPQTLEGYDIDKYINRLNAE